MMSNCVKCGDELGPIASAEGLCAKCVMQPINAKYDNNPDALAKGRLAGDGKQQEARTPTLTFDGLDYHCARCGNKQVELCEHWQILLKRAHAAIELVQPSHASGELGLKAFIETESGKVMLDSLKTIGVEFECTVNGPQFTNAAFQRGQQAEKAAQLRETALAILMDPYIGNFSMYKQFAAPKADAIEAAIRSLAGAEPDFIPNKENE